MIKRLSHINTLVFKTLLLKLGFMSVVFGVPENLWFFVSLKDIFFCSSLKDVYSLLQWWTSGLVETSQALESDMLGFQSHPEQVRTQTNRIQQAVKAQHPTPAETFSPSSLGAGPVQLSVSFILVWALSLTGKWNWASSTIILELNFLAFTETKASLLRHCKNSMKWYKKTSYYIGIQQWGWWQLIVIRSITWLFCWSYTSGPIWVMWFATNRSIGTSSIKLIIIAPTMLFDLL